MPYFLVWSLLILLQQPTTQQQSKQFFAERQRLQTQATNAFDAEMTREKAGDCTNALTTYASNICLAKESEKSEANYKAFAGALRSILAQVNPLDTQPPVAGPTGTPRTREELLKGFDDLESAWRQYLKLALGTAYDQYKSGTLAPSFEMAAGQTVLRSHMRELKFLYGRLFL